MPDDPESRLASRRRMLNLFLTGGATAMLPAAIRAADPSAIADNSLNWAVAWKQTAAEFRALCYQAFNVATLQLERALARQSDGDKPLAVITDMDDTILHANDYWPY